MNSVERDAVEAKVTDALAPHRVGFEWPDYGASISARAYDATTSEARAPVTLKVELIRDAAGLASFIEAVRRSSGRYLIRSSMMD